jgi:hypothetical protein
VNTPAASKKTPEAKEWVDPSGRGTKGTQADFGGTNLSGFISEVANKGGLYKPNLFLVMIDPPKGLPFSDTEGKRQISYLCNSAALPGVQILSNDHRRQGYGPFDRRAFGVQVTDIPLTFFVDNSGHMLRFFHSWFDQIVHYHYGSSGKDGSGGGEHSVAQTSSGDAQLFELGYRENYITKIHIYCFDHSGSKILHYILHEAYPIQMGDLTVAWAESDSYSILPIQFTFRTYDVNQMDPHPDIGAGFGGENKIYVAGRASAGTTGRSMNIVGALSTIAGTIGMVKNMASTPLSVGSAINLVNNQKLFAGAASNIF